MFMINHPLESQQKSDKKIDIKPHAPYGSKQVRDDVTRGACTAQILRTKTRFEAGFDVEYSTSRKQSLSASAALNSSPNRESLPHKTVELLYTYYNDVMAKRVALNTKNDWTSFLPCCAV